MPRSTTSSAQTSAAAPSVGHAGAASPRAAARSQSASLRLNSAIGVARDGVDPGRRSSSDSPRSVSRAQPTSPFAASWSSIEVVYPETLAGRIDSSQAPAGASRPCS